MSDAAITRKPSLGPWLCVGSPTEDELRANPRPWLTEDSVRFLEESVRNSDVCIEYGGGWSSLWWAQKCAWTITLEADPFWAQRLLAEFADRPDLITKWEMRFVGCEWSAVHTTPKQYWSRHGSHLTPEIARKMEDAYLAVPRPADVIVIDGSVRPRNAEVVDAYVRANPGIVRLIVVDNMESMARPVAGKFQDYIEHAFSATNPDMIPTHQNGKHVTSVFVLKG